MSNSVGQSWRLILLAGLCLASVSCSDAVEHQIKQLKSESPETRQPAAEALGKLGDARAVEPLIACLKDWQVRQPAAEALGRLGDARAVDPLRAALPDWKANEAIGLALEKLGWQPTSDAEQVYLWICRRDGSALRAGWEKTKQVLLADLESGDRRKIENAVYTSVSLGDEKIVPDLVRILNTVGNVPMAETYLNCGHGGLRQAAQSWAKQRGYQILMLPGAHEAGWGRW